MGRGGIEARNTVRRRGNPKGDTLISLGQSASRKTPQKFTKKIINPPKNLCNVYPLFVLDLDVHGVTKFVRQIFMTSFAGRLL